VGKESLVKKVNKDLSKVKCFNCDTMDIWPKITLPKVSCFSMGFHGQNKGS